ncbi:DUF3107 domain-containing protein [Corynebacterium tapiri]|uniref:DUF3107 domain-containing protein n=1 Tax=Corynebacterium tapiri TaxID=1448266 RepID=A0A5C4U4C3_9CORY|nr:DUF3107 domain-containing protein [Corynebacterium tapiri]TNL98401.1 DUF3107 domain-containing protein [Corynebacterium tapiri]
MDIKIGFSENPRELVLSAKDNREELLQRLSEGLKSGAGFIELVDSKAHTYFLNAAEVAYVEVSSAARPAVGFGGA